METTVKIRLLGDFYIEYQGVKITRNKLSSQICSLVAYLVVKREAPVELFALYDILWPNGITNPASALKNLVYRFRKAASEAGMLCEIIVNENSSYRLNPQLTYDIDCEQFEACSKATTNKYESYEKGLNLYKGTFCVCLEKKEWVATYANHYSSLYFDMAYKLLAKYEKDAAWAKMLDLAKHASNLNIWEENIHKYIMIAMFNNGNSKGAINHYNYIRELYYRELGVEVNLEIQSIYELISRTSNTINKSLDYFMEDIREAAEDIISSYYCDYDVFKQIYRYKSRCALRDGSSFLVVMVTITEKDGSTPNNEVTTSSMSVLSAVIARFLRKEDVYTRSSPRQILVLLNGIDIKLADIVVQRITKNFNSDYKGKKLALEFAISD